jgi:multidrug efflux system outer membrane protein
MRNWLLVLVFTGGAAAPLGAQQAALERLTFDEAVRRAIANNPSVQQAAAGIIRAEALLQQVRSLSLPSADATVTSRTIGPVFEFAGEAVTPRTQAIISPRLTVPLLTPVRWAERAQARDQVLVAQRTSEDVKRAIGVAAAQAYLAVITEKRVLELNERSRDNARAHFEYAQQRYEGGLGSRLNALRAQQELSSDEARVEDARLAIRRAQEALGVLAATDGPVDAADEPAFDTPADLASGSTPPTPDFFASRTDVQLLNAQVAAAERVASDAWKEYLPSVTGLVEPQILAPTGLFAPSRSWSASLVFSVPLFDWGQRRGLSRERRALLEIARSARGALERQATSETRTAIEAVRSSERALVSAQAAADQAEEVVRITDVAFRTGATTNIEVIDAQRRARDAETQAAIAEDAVRRAKLDLLVALGRFPR